MLYTWNQLKNSATSGTEFAVHWFNENQKKHRIDADYDINIRELLQANKYDIIVIHLGDERKSVMDAYEKTNMCRRFARDWKNRIFLVAESCSHPMGKEETLNFFDYYTDYLSTMGFRDYPLLEQMILVYEDFVRV